LRGKAICRIILLKKQSAVKKAAVEQEEISMDIKAKIEEIAAKIQKDPKLIAKFKNDPVKVVEQLIGIDISDEIVEKIVSGVKLAMASDKVEDALGALGALKKLF